MKLVIAILVLVTAAVAQTQAQDLIAVKHCFGFRETGMTCAAPVITGVDPFAAYKVTRQGPQLKPRCLDIGKIAQGAADIKLAVRADNGICDIVATTPDGKIHIASGWNGKKITAPRPFVGPVQPPPVMEFATSSTSSVLALMRVEPDARSSVFSIFDNSGKETLRIGVDGTITFGLGVTPNEAAKSLVKALKEMGGLRSACEPAK